MKKNEEALITQTEKKQAAYKATAEYLFQEVTELVVNNFVATYKKQGNTLAMRLPSGKMFEIIVREA